MHTTPTPLRTHALAVGVETYGLGLEWDLNGPVVAACRFADWLLGRDVPPEQIHLFLSPLSPDEAARLTPAALRTPAPATSGNITAVIKGLMTRPGDVLYVFWAGHGVMSVDGATRRLYLADATHRYPHNLNLLSLLTSLRSSAFQYFPNQVIFVDACADFCRGPEEGLGGAELKFPNTAVFLDRLQSALLAAGPGEKAELSGEGTCLFSGEVLDHLSASPKDLWPPDVRALEAGVREWFRRRRAESGEGQLPILLEHRMQGEPRWLEGDLSPGEREVLHAYIACERRAIQGQLNNFLPAAVRQSLAEGGRFDPEALTVPPRVATWGDPPGAARPAPAAAVRSVASRAWRWLRRWVAFAAPALSSRPRPTPPRADESLPARQREQVRAFEDAFAEWERTGRLMVVLGDPGYGKTWLVARLTWGLLGRLEQAANDDSARALAPLPLRLTCRELAKELAREDGPTFQAAVAAVVARRLGDETPKMAEPFRELVRERFRQGEVFLLLDGWEEIDQEQDDGRLADALRGWVGAGLGRLLLTSRPIGRPRGLLPGTAEWVLLPLEGPEGVERLVRTRLGDRAEGLIAPLVQNIQFGELARIPLLGVLALRMVESDKATAVQENPSAFLETCLKQLLYEAWADRLTSGADADTVLLALGALAYETFQGGRWVIRTMELQAALARSDAGRTLGSPAAELQTLLTRAGIFTAAGLGELEVLHQSFAEFFFAWHIDQRVRLKELALTPWLRKQPAERLLDPQWQEVWLHLARLVDDATPLLGSLLALHRRGWLSRRRGRAAGLAALLLAGRCLAAAKCWDTREGRRVLRALYAAWRDKAIGPLWPLEYREDQPGEERATQEVIIALAHAGNNWLLDRGLRDSSGPVRQRAAWAASKLGAGAAAYEDGLREAARDHRRPFGLLQIMGRAWVGLSLVVLLEQALRFVARKPSSTGEWLFFLVLPLGLLLGMVLLVLVAGPLLGWLTFRMHRDAALAARGEAARLLGILCAAAPNDIPLALPPARPSGVRPSLVRDIAWMVGGIAIALGLEVALNPLGLGGQGFFGLLKLNGYYDGWPTRYWAAQARDIHPGARFQAVYALGKIAPGDARAIPPLVEALRDENDSVRKFAILRLSLLPEDVGKRAIPALRERLNDNDPEVRTGAAALLKRLDPVAGADR